MNAFLQKSKEVLLAVLPVTVIVLLLQVTVLHMEWMLIYRFLLGAVLMLPGLALFLVGVDIGIAPIGDRMGAGIAKSNKLAMVIFAALVLGFFITLAEPDLHILSGQVSAATLGGISKWGLLLLVSAGIAGALTLGFLRILHNMPLYIILLILYGIILLLSFFSKPVFLAVAFDASGATTGAITVPFFITLSIGVSVLKKDSKASEKDSFGLVSITSAGAVIAVLLAGLFLPQPAGTTAGLPAAPVSQGLFTPFIRVFFPLLGETALSLLPIAALFFLYNLFSRKLRGRALWRVAEGLLYTLSGLTLFLTAVNGAFLDVGRETGVLAAGLTANNQLLLVGLGVLLGAVSIITEPAVYVLTEQIEEVTGGFIRRRAVLVALAVGVGLAVGLSVIRVLVPAVQLWHFLLPGYLAALILTFFVPKLFVGISFDAGGIASGTMTATFILAFVQGCAQRVETASILVDGFGMMATVAMIPIVTMQLLGFMYRLQATKSRREVPGVDKTYSLGVLILNYGKASKALKLARKAGVSGGTVLLGRGTAQGALTRALAFESRKEVLLLGAESDVAKAAMQAVCKRLQLHKPYRGIGYLTNISAFMGSGYYEFKRQKQGRQSAMYDVITIIVEKGRAEEAVEAARRAGSRGGTILHGRGAGVHETARLFAMDIEPEKEIVLILSPEADTFKIVSTVRDDLRLNEPGTGLLFVQKASQVYGLSPEPCKKAKGRKEPEPEAMQKNEA